MKIIRFAPKVANGAGEQLLRVLTFGNGSYVLHFTDAKGLSKLSLFDWHGALIKNNVRAESAYVFKNGNYILLYEPTNSTAGVGRVRLRRMYRMFSRDGRVMFDNIDCFTPLSDDWIVLLQDGHKYLYDNKGRQVDKDAFDFVKFDGGYARINTRLLADGNAQLLKPGDLGKWLSFNNRMKNIVFGEQLAYDWTICSETGEKLFTVNNGLAVLGGGYVLAQYHDGKVFFHYPDGMMGAETTLYSGAGKNIACLVNLSLAKMCLSACGGQPVITYCRSRAVDGAFSLNKPLTDVYEFANGNFSAVYENKLCFFREGCDEPEIRLPLDEPSYFLPDGCFWNAERKVLYGNDAAPVMDGVDNVIDLGLWYLVEKNGKQTVFSQDGAEIMQGVQLIRKINGLLVLRLADGTVGIFHRGKGILPPIEESRLAFAESAF